LGHEDQTWAGAWRKSPKCRGMVWKSCETRIRSCSSANSSTWDRGLRPGWHHAPIENPWRAPSPASADDRAAKTGIREVADHASASPR
jgi:hypothetical protein